MLDESVKTIAGVILKDDDGRYLLVQERKPSAYGLWNLPAGHVNPGESDREAATREAYEEVGLEVEIADEMPFHIETTPLRKISAFLAKIVGGSLTVNDEELLDARWFPLSEIELLNGEGKIRAQWVMDSIHKAEQHTKSDELLNE